jgi:DNA invertase Pin-like site-specific DNA recombinase
MSTGVYIRVSSTKGQQTDSRRLAEASRAQRRAGFLDRESGASLHREPFQKLQATIFAGKITASCGNSTGWLAVPKEGVNVLANWCQPGIQVIAITQQIDLSGPVDT